MYGTQLLLNMPDFTNVFMHIYAKRGVLSSETIVFGVGRSFVVVFEKNMMIGFSPLWGARKKTTKGYEISMDQ